MLPPPPPPPPARKGGAKAMLKALTANMSAPPSTMRPAALAKPETAPEAAITPAPSSTAPGPSPAMPIPGPAKAAANQESLTAKTLQSAPKLNLAKPPNASSELKVKRYLSVVRSALTTLVLRRARSDTDTVIALLLQGGLGEDLLLPRVTQSTSQKTRNRRSAAAKERRRNKTKNAKD